MVAKPPHSQRSRGLSIHRTLTGCTMALATSSKDAGIGSLVCCSSALVD